MRTNRYKTYTELSPLWIARILIVLGVLAGVTVSGVVPYITAVLMGY
jgi:phage shock protein PspC (stress-responsive transcriptional regulator)